MPFIKSEKRDEINKKGLSATKAVGDICYYYYKQMVDKWKKEPRWKTAHAIYKKMLNKTSLLQRQFTAVHFDDFYCLPDKIQDKIVAYNLAWQVFFQLYVMPYEEKKEKINGPI